jgi:hypothetical protein
MYFAVENVGFCEKKNHKQKRRGVSKYNTNINNKVS